MDVDVSLNGFLLIRIISIASKIMFRYFLISSLRSIAYLAVSKFTQFQNAAAAVAVSLKGYRQVATLFVWLP